MGYRGEIKFKFKPTLSYMEYGLSTNAFGIHEDSNSFDYVGIAGDNTKDCVDPLLYKVGDRIGQLIIIPYPHIEFKEVEELSDTVRGDRGFGSTGK